MHHNSRPAIDRLAARVALTDAGCVEWLGYVERNGYARIWVDRKNVGAHRWVYEYHFGPIGQGLVIDHLCRNKRCVNPDHLEAVTGSENVLRGIGPSGTRERAAQRTHCAQGHPYDEPNLYVDPAGRRHCLTCKRQAGRAHYQQNRDRYIEKAAEWRQTNTDRARELARIAARRRRSEQKAS